MADVASVSKAFDEACWSQIHLPRTPTASKSLPLWNDFSLNDLRTIVRDVVRVVLGRRGRLAPLGPVSGHDFNLHSVIREEIAAALPLTRAAQTLPPCLDVRQDTLPTAVVFTQLRLL